MASFCYLMKDEFDSNERCECNMIICSLFITRKQAKDPKAALKRPKKLITTDGLSLMN